MTDKNKKEIVVFVVEYFLLRGVVVLSATLTLPSISLSCPYHHFLAKQFEFSTTVVLNVSHIPSSVHHVTLITPAATPSPILILGSTNCCAALRVHMTFFIYSELQHYQRTYGRREWGEIFDSSLCWIYCKVHCFCSMDHFYRIYWNATTLASQLFLFFSSDVCSYHAAAEKQGERSARREKRKSTVCRSSSSGRKQ